MLQINIQKLCIQLTASVSKGITKLPFATILNASCWHFSLCCFVSTALAKILFVKQNLKTENTAAWWPV